MNSNLQSKKYNESHTNLTTVETKAATSVAYSEQKHDSLGNQRYSDSNMKSEPHYTEEIQHNTDTTTTHNNMPFYLNKSNQISQDEDVESFQRKLDTLIVNFRSETMSEFMKTKK